MASKLSVDDQPAGAAKGVTVSGATVTFEGSEYVEVKEGSATILFPAAGEVFYNPVQEFNRDLSIAVLNHFSTVWATEQGALTTKRAGARAKYDAATAAAAAAAATAAGAPAATTVDAAAGAAVALPADNVAGLTVLEALSATGLRAVRYYNEIDGLTNVVANDMSAEAVAAIRRNVVYNKLDPVAQVTPNEDDAIDLMYRHRGKSDRYPVVDLDPYGSAGPFLDAAVQAVEDGGLLCVTCTDMAVLAGNHGEACFAKYGAYSVRSAHCKETAVRIILYSIASAAARFKRYIVPVVSTSIDFYCRVFVRVYTSAAEVKKTASKMAQLYNCTGCHAFHLQRLGRVEVQGKSTKYKAPIGPAVGPKCDECGGSFHLGGPMWAEPIHDRAFVNSVLDGVRASPGKYGTEQRLIGYLSVIAEELEDHPLYYTAPSLSGRAHCITPSLLDIRSGLLNAGYKVSSSHADKDALKTDAPSSAVWDMMRAWVKLHPVKNLPADSPATRLLAIEPKVAYSFEVHPEANPKSRAAGINRFQQNPLPNWGPKARAKRRKPTDDATDATATLEAASEADSVSKKLKADQPPT